MKKTVFIIALSVLALTSCKKNYSCTYKILGSEFTTEYEDLDKEEAAESKEACESIGGDWALESL